MPRLDIENYTNSHICEMPAKMLLVESKSLCKIINVEYNAKELIDIKFKKHRSKCRNSSTSVVNVTLVGYYIETQNSLSASSNRFLFFPVWLRESSGSFIEEITQPLIVPSYAVGGSSNLPSGCNADLILNLMNVNSSTFDHDDFQFSSHYPNFDKAFISRHELFMIMQFADFVGIVGARISSGNFVAIDSNGEGTLSLNECNTNYFTYRFIGFNAVRCIGLRKNQVALNRADRTSEKSPSFDHTIPAETWALPCPPRWKPQ